MKQFVDATLGLLALDLILIVLSGGFSVLGSVEASGFLFRIVVSLLLLVLRYRVTGSLANARLCGYLAILLVCLPLVHLRGYRLRGDAMWYYAYTRSLAFDRDLDFSNEYRRLGVDHFRGSQPVPDTGLPRNTFPIGAGLLWIPFLALGYVGAGLRNVYGQATAYDGFSDPYLHAVALGGLLIGWLGLLVLDRLLRRWFSPGVAFAASAGAVLGSFLFWYISYQSIYSHAPSFLIAVLIVERWARGPKSKRDFAVLGLLVGAAACVRWQNAIFGFLPLWSVTGILLERPRLGARNLGVLAATFLIGLAPQLLAWKTIFGRFYLGVPVGADFMRWSQPFLTEMLFSSRHGLFSWSPLLIFAAVAFLVFVRREPRIGIPLALLLAGITYVNSSVADWWAGGSFGARRFDSAIPIFAIGLATGTNALVALVRRRPEIVAGCLLLIFILMNGLLMEQYRKGRIPVDDTISWEVASRGMLEDVFDGVGYPFSFPANWAFALRYGRPKTQYDILVGKHLFHWTSNLGGVIDFGEKDPPYLGNGWSSLADWEGRPRGVRFAIAAPAGVFVPTDRTETLRIFVSGATPPGSQPQWIEVWLNGDLLGGFRPGAEMKEHPLLAPERWWRRINLLEFRPGEEASGEPFLALDRIRFERVAN